MFSFLVPSLGTAKYAIESRGSGVFLRQGFVWVLEPRRLRRPTWRKCWADIRAGHLILRQLHKERIHSESAVPLAESDVVLFGSLFATSLSRWLSSLGVHGFELTSSDFDAPLVVRVESV